jgi:hypothetical protein
MEEPTVLERLDDGQVRIGKGHVLADDADAHRRCRGLDPIDEDLPLRQIDVEILVAEQLAHELVEALVVHDERHLIEVSHISRVDHRFDGNVAQVGDLALEIG